MALLRIPGYYDRAAARLERLQDYWRDFAFLGLDETLRIPGCHVVDDETGAKRYLPARTLEIRQLTLRKFVQLCALRNPFLVGGRIGAEHIAQILWLLSPEYDKRTTDPEARTKFVTSIASFPFYSAVRAISRYMDRQFMDKPAMAVGAKSTKIDTSVAASMIDGLASAYGWSGEEILELPMGRLFQYLRKISRSADPDLLKFNPLVDKYKARVMAEFFAARKAAKKESNGDQS